MLLLTPELCRAARALLALGQRELAIKAGIAHKTLADFERGVRSPYGRTIKDLVDALEAAGIVFSEHVEGVRGPSVALKWELEMSLRSKDTTKAAAPGASGLKALDQEMADYWAERPEQWASFSQSGRQALSIEMFGDPYAADEAFGNDAR
jgi:transcriptional regulator with XRE-family HTH domain